ncbi:Glycogen recognition site of AMP-activated protein kinase [Desulfonatronum thiosulfatophilum]|uniref:Glycogen recognition site of AMP-activated protein kinase n=1 Tax=Desulfonatronum thiosulfatophilum TaxID=617002 RepID=A0A1G6DBL2_9BACT|nr:isoamylase early set domain-containing protein [Desulfonatronum thiosulfatophilum]SDB42544.1 Glycogen recognition site of AMP-activated protein kinase [Desulfonatronum thiosulfatophilum]
MTKHTETDLDQSRIAGLISRLDYSLPPGDVTATVMRRIKAQHPAPAASRRLFRLTDLWRWLITPKPLRIVPAAPLGAGLVVMLLVFVLTMGKLEEPMGDLAENEGAGAQAGLPVSDMVLGGMDQDLPLVVFMVQAEDARKVSLVGSFNNWRDHGFEMRPVENLEGYWAISVALERGQHEYAFLVNGEQIMDDPQALLSVDDDFGNRNSVIIVEDHEQAYGYS